MVAAKPASEDRVANRISKASGFGDLTTRLKIHFWGNDGGPTAFAMMPFVKWPLTASGIRNGETEGGVIFILGYELPSGWSSAVMTEVDLGSAMVWAVTTPNGSTPSPSDTI